LRAYEDMQPDWKVDVPLWASKEAGAAEAAALRLATKKRDPQRKRDPQLRCGGSVGSAGRGRSFWQSVVVLESEEDDADYGTHVGSVVSSYMYSTNVSSEVMSHVSSGAMSGASGSGMSGGGRIVSSAATPLETAHAGGKHAAQHELTREGGDDPRCDAGAWVGDGSIGEGGTWEGDAGSHVFGGGVRIESVEVAMSGGEATAPTCGGHEVACPPAKGDQELYF